MGNNLSFPVIWGDGAGLSLPGEFLQASLTVPWTGTNPCLGGLVPYAQKTEDNLWQAENSAAGPYLEEGHLYVDQIDWGDSLESVDMKVGRPVRVELSLYKALVDPMTGYEMVMLANPSSPNEVQGVCAGAAPTTEATISKYESTEATVYSPTVKLVIQKIDGAPELLGTPRQAHGPVGAPQLHSPSPVSSTLAARSFTGCRRAAGSPARPAPTGSRSSSRSAPTSKPGSTPRRSSAPRSRSRKRATPVARRRRRRHEQPHLHRCRRARGWRLTAEGGQAADPTASHQPSWGGSVAHGRRILPTSMRAENAQLSSAGSSQPGLDGSTSPMVSRWVQVSAMVRLRSHPRSVVGAPG